MRKPAFCICEKKDANQLRSYCLADQRLCFRYTDSTIFFLPESEISSRYPSIAVQSGLYGTNETHEIQTCMCTCVSFQVKRVIKTFAAKCA